MIKRLTNGCILLLALALMTIGCGTALADGAIVNKIAAGYDFTEALKSDGIVWDWGRAGNDYLRNYSLTGHGEFLSGVVTAIAAGYNHIVVLKSDGTVWGWGDNAGGQLGDGDTNSIWGKPVYEVQALGLSGVTAVAAGGSHSVALKSDGTVWAWGYNDSGQLGDGTTTNRSTPVKVSGLSGVIAIAAGCWGQYTVALKSDGTVWAWGDNNSGQLGDGTTHYWGQTTPVQVSGLSGVTAIAAGVWQTMALKSDGTVWAWGDNSYGQLGDATTTIRSTPVKVLGLSGVTAISTGESHSVALKNDGTVWAWGNNGSGQLGH